MTRRKTAAKPALRFPLVVESFRDPTYYVHQCRSDAPSAFNGTVEIRRYRVTAELIDEPIEVLRDRLRMLWLTSERNHHRWPTMRAVAAELGMDPSELRADEQGSQNGRTGR